MKYDIITILGPTAVGKTKLAVSLAEKFSGEIISADSRQVYKGMDIGTGKDLEDYKIGDKTVPYHLIDVCDPKDEFDLYQFNKLFYKAFEQIRFQNRIPFLVGGTGLYLHSILSGYKMSEVDFNSPRAEKLSYLSDDELRQMLIAKSDSLHNKTDLVEKERIIKAILIAESKKNEQKSDLISFNIGVKLPREEIRESITKRLKQRLQNGMIEEVQQLLENGVEHSKLQFFGLEYKFISLYLKNELNYNDMYQKLNSAIHNFAKRQMTWFRKMEREGIKIHWINGPDLIAAENLIEKNYSGND